ncbi:MAG: aminopeptidase P family protein [Parachlamydiaceae bacterium]|nr:aminopeptidase P family protein [Parachlamydiaceae bacterium]
MNMTRIQNALEHLEEWNCNALLIEDKINLYYLTGLQLSAGKLLLSNKPTLFVDARYYEMCKKSSPVPVELVETSQDPLQQLLKAWNCSGVQTLGVDGETCSHKHYLAIEKSLNEYTKATISLKSLDNPIRTLRMIKDPYECQRLREAALLGSQGFDFVCSHLRTGISEAELALELELFWKKKGSKGLAFEPIIAFAKNSSMPHYRAGDERLKPGDAVLVDIGVNFEHYHSDMTRMVYYGTPNPKMLAIHAIVQEAQAAALKMCKPGTTIGALDKAARDHISAKGYGEYFTHSLGHGVGLEIHELPAIRNGAPYKDMVLEAGMVVTIEPGIYLSDLGGVRIENTVIITENGYEDLTLRSPKPLIKTIDI